MELNEAVESLRWMGQRSREAIGHLPGGTGTDDAVQAVLAALEQQGREHFRSAFYESQSTDPLAEAIERWTSSTPPSPQPGPSR